MNYTRGLTVDSKKIKLQPEVKALADLMAIGWKDMDAFIVLGLYKSALSDDYNKRQLDKTIGRDEFQSYFRLAERKFKNRQKKNESEAENVDSSDKLDSSSKESVIEHLNMLYENATDTKQKADILMKIADLQRMKQDENIEDDQLVHFYMPLQCSMCNLYNKAKNEKE